MAYEVGRIVEVFDMGGSEMEKFRAFRQERVGL